MTENIQSPIHVVKVCESGQYQPFVLIGFMLLFIVLIVVSVRKK